MGESRNTELRMMQGGVKASQVALVVKNLLPIQEILRDMGLIPGSGGSPGGGLGDPLQDSCLENTTSRQA